MAVSLELRVPLVDQCVVELLAAIAMSARFQPVGRKQLLRDAALGSLPTSLFDRPKSGFVLPLDVWLRQSLKERVEVMLTDRVLCESVGLSPEAIGRLWHDYSGGAHGLYWSRVWALYVFLWWCKRYGVMA
jgi:asparagine synthase (glutamine-hydrolysing)